MGCCSWLDQYKQTHKHINLFDSQPLSLCVFELGVWRQGRLARSSWVTQVWSLKLSLSTCPWARRKTQSAHSLGRKGEEYQLNETWSSAGFSVATAASLWSLSSVKSLRRIFKVITHCLRCLILQLGALNSWKIHKHALSPTAFVWTVCFHMVLFKPLCAEHFWPKQFCSRIISVVGV